MRSKPWLPFIILALVGCFLVSGAAQQPGMINLRPRIGAPDAGVPPVRVTVDRRRVPLGTSVLFTLSPASVVNDYVVTLYFGDGEKRLMTEPETGYLYPAVGNYTYAVDVKPRQRCQPRVTLSASANSISEGEAVRFSAQLSGNCPNIQYRFVFGDGSSSNWQSSRDAQHSYASAGKYLAYVDISEGNSRIGGSPRKRVDVTRKPDVIRRSDVAVSLTAEPLSAQPGKPVTFRAKASPARADARYQFNFGDGDRTSWQTDPQSTHTYRTRGTYRPYVQVSQFVNNQTVSATSAPAVLRVRPGPDTTPDPDPSPTPRPGSRPTPTSVPSPTASDSPTPSPGNGSPSPGNGSPSPGNGSPSPGNGSPSPGNGSPSPGSSPSGSNGAAVMGSETPSSPSVTPTPDDASSSNRWWYLLIAAVILFLVYQASGLLFATQPTFAPFADQGVAAVAHEKGAVPVNFELVLNPNVSGGDYSVTTDQPRLVTNSPQPEDRQIIEI